MKFIWNNLSVVGDGPTYTRLLLAPRTSAQVAPPETLVQLHFAPHPVTFSEQGLPKSQESYLEMRYHIITNFEEYCDRSLSGKFFMEPPSTLIPYNHILKELDRHFFLRIGKVV